MYAYFVALAEAELQSFQTNLPKGDAAAALDLTNAQGHDRVHRAHFFELVNNRADDQRKLELIWEKGMDALTKQSFFVLQTLALANGSVVLGALSYLGRDGAKSPQVPFIWVVAFGGVGFLLVLLAATIGTMTMQKPLENVLTMTKRYISEKELADLSDAVKVQANRTKTWSRTFGFASAGCLIAALIVGVGGLR